MTTSIDQPQLWVPGGVTQGPTRSTGAETIYGRRIVKHVFKFHDARTGKTGGTEVLAYEGQSFALIEDAAARSFERWLEDVRSREHKRPPTAEERIEIGRAIREFREHAARRRESTTGQLYFAGMR